MHKKMAEASKIRLVRCPKCENLLSELSDYAVYECGGCGAFLRAKKKACEGETVEGYRKPVTISEKLSGSLGSLTETERESDDVELDRRKDRVFVQGKVNLVSVSSSRTEDTEVLIGHDYVDVRREKNKGLRLDQSKAEKEIRSTDKFRQSSKDQIDNWVGGGDDHDMNSNGCNFGKRGTLGMVKDIGQVSALFETSAETMRSRVVLDSWGVEREGFRGFDDDPMEVAEQSRFPSFAHPDEGPSNYEESSFYGHGESLKNAGYMDRPNRVENSEQERAELLRKMNELKVQISRLGTKPGEKIPNDRKMAPPGSYGSRVTCNVSMQSFSQGKHFPKPPKFNHSPRPVPFKNDHTLDMHNFHPPPRHVPHEIPDSNYEDPFRSQKFRRPPNRSAPQFPQHSPHDYFPGHYMDYSHDLIASHPREPFLHQSQSACSCLHCYRKHRQVPPQVPGPGFGNRRFAKKPTSSNLSYHANPITSGPQNHTPLSAIPPPFHSQDPQPRTRWPIDIASDVDGLYQSRPRRVAVAHESRQICCPIAGGAPFIACSNCFELLQLPRKLITKANSQQKLKCCTCSIVYSFEIKNKRLIISVPAETKKISSEVKDSSSHDLLNEGVPGSHGCSNAGGMNSDSIDFDNSQYSFQSADTNQNLHLEDEMLNLHESDKRLTLSVQAETKEISSEVKDSSHDLLNEGVRGSHGCSNAGGMNSDSVDFDNSQYSFHSADAKQNLHLEDERLNLHESDKRQGHTSSSSISTEKQEGLDSVIVQRDVSNSTEPASKEDMSPTVAGSPFSYHFNDSSSIHVVSSTPEGNMSKQTDQEKVILIKSVTRQNYEKDVSVETSMSQDTIEVSQEEQHSINKGRKTFFVDLIKKGFRDFTRFNHDTENERPNVSVNGRSIPDHLVKKAEKFAGPIYPGDYWYDSRTGFWGVMHQPCLGVITPFIAEFNSPMPENCAAGNTGVFVNGRELNQTDLELLARRGLPNTRNKKYYVEMSGRVVDVDSGKELYSLGRLAPTVEKVKTGFGMWTPKVAL